MEIAAGFEIQKTIDILADCDVTASFTLFC